MIQYYAKPVNDGHYIVRDGLLIIQDLVYRLLLEVLKTTKTQLHSLGMVLANYTTVQQRDTTS